MPDTLSPQVPVIEEVLDALGIARVGVERYEADDVIGTFTTGAGEPGRHRHRRPRPVPAGRRRRGVRVLYPLKGVGRLELTDEAWLREKYGVRRRRTPIWRRCAATRATGCPACPGSARRRRPNCCEFGDLAGIIAAAQDPDGDMGPGPCGKIKAAADYLVVAPRWSRSPATSTSAPPISRSPASRPTREMLAALSEKFGLGGSVERLVETLAR